MYRPLTPALAALAVFALTACSDAPLGPQTPSGTEGGSVVIPGSTGGSSGGSTSGSSGGSTSGSNTGSTSGNNSDTGSDGTSGHKPVSYGDQDGGSTGGDAGSTGGDSGSTGGDSGSTGGDSGNTGGDSGNTGGDSGNDGSSSTSTPVLLNGSTPVTVSTGEVVGYRSSPVPASAGGICGDGTNYPLGTWVKTTDGVTSEHPMHQLCTRRQDETTITVSFSLSGNWVVSTNGNLLLEIDASRRIAYDATQNVTAGAGIILGEGSDGSVWTLDLAQIQHAGSYRAATDDGIAERMYMGLVANRDDGAAILVGAVLGW